MLLTLFNWWQFMTSQHGSYIALIFASVLWRPRSSIFKKVLYGSFYSSWKLENIYGLHIIVFSWYWLIYFVLMLSIITRPAFLMKLSGNTLGVQWRCFVVDKEHWSRQWVVNHHLSNTNHHFLSGQKQEYKLTHIHISWQQYMTNVLS